MASMGSKRAARSRCGVYDCSSCSLYIENACPGCASGNLRLMRENETQCLVYQCVRELGIAGCHECVEASCRLESWPPSRCPLRGRSGAGSSFEDFEEKLSATRGLAAFHPERRDGADRRSERLRAYLAVLDDYRVRDVATVSSHQLAREVGVRSSLVRRDLSGLGNFGTPGRGYDVKRLRSEIRRVLSVATERRTIWLGAVRSTDWKASRLALESVNCALVGVFDDVCPGENADGLIVQPLAKASREARRRRASVAVLAGEEAADAAVLDGLVEAGVEAVLNLTSARLPACANVVIEPGDLASQMLRLLSRLGADISG
jgi:redox-sensing transcriptional repressor